VYSVAERRQGSVDSLPEQASIYPKVLMGEYVSEMGEASPVDRWIASADFLR
jgi:hypothetical protein